MEKSTKKLVSMRLSPETVKELTGLAARHKVSQADVVAVLVHAFETGADADATEEMLNLASRV